MVTWVFQFIDTFCLSCQIYVFRIFSYYPFDICRVYSDISCFISDTGNLYLLSFLFFLRVLLISLIFSRTSCFIDSLMIFSFQFHWFCSYLYYLLPAACFGFIFYYFSKFLRWDFRWLYFSSFLIYAFSTICFPLSIAVAVYYKFWCCIFSFIQFNVFLKIPLEIYLWPMDNLEAW